jgi:hypothetical protein
MEMNVKIIYGIIGIIIIAAGVYFLLPSMNNKVEASQEVQVAPLHTVDTAPLVAYQLSDTEKTTAEKQIGVVNNEATFIQRMIEISLQKVQIGNDQYGIPGIPPNQIHRIQMTEGNIEYLREGLDHIKTANYHTYETILNKWLTGNFKNITSNVQTLLSYMEKTGQISGSFQVTQRSYAEEQQYYTQFFTGG